MKPHSRSFVSIVALLLFLTGINTEVFAQKKSEKADYLPDILIVKLNPSNSSYFTDSLSLQGFRLLIAPVKAEKIVKLFPNSSLPTAEGHVDLSRIYSITFSGVEKSALIEFANRIASYGAFEYVELHYIDHQHAAVFVPTDPYVAVNNVQRYLSRMQAYEAWAIEKGDPNVIIGIIDTGVDYLHEDIIGNIAYNTSDTINGVDDDGDGYKDNYYGWDLGNNDNNPIPPTTNYHGAFVASIAGASTNNGKGIAGVGFNSRILPIKASTDASSAIIKGYEGIVYAADHGCKVINLSWGGTGNYSAYNQDVINYAALNKDVLIVAAAGNTDEEADYYPAAYDHVLSVVGMDTVYSTSAKKYIDTRADFKRWGCCYKSTIAHSVDIGAQGYSLTTILNGNSYTPKMDGSSFASPIIAGAAAIVRSHFPKLTALQAAELLRVTADVVDTFPENAAFKEKMGKGRVNMYKALTMRSPSVRMIRTNAYTKLSTSIFNGDTVTLTADFWNYLRATTNLTIDFSSASANIKILNATFHAGIVDSMKGISNTTAPFTFILLSSASQDQIIEFRLGYKDPATGYSDYQYFTLTVNPSYVILSNDSVSTTITGNGRFGYEDINSSIGNGFEKNGSNLLYEGGLMIGYSPTRTPTCVRGYPSGSSDVNFKVLNNPRFVPSNFAYEETFCKFNDSATGNLPIGVEIIQQSYTLNSGAFENTVFMQYKIINRSTTDFDSIYIGHFIDWDIQSYLNNRADYDPANRLGYAYNINSNGLYAGISLLTNQNINYYALDNSNVGGNNIYTDDGFTKAEKYKSLSSGISRTKAGTATTGNDIAMVMSGRVNHLNKGDTAVVAFALVAGNSLAELKSFSASALTKFIQINTGPIPSAKTYTLCSNDTATLIISPSQGNKFRFYDVVPTGATTPVHIGKTFTLLNVTNADTIYITNVDSLYESTYVMYIINMNEAPVADFSVTPATATSATSFLNQSSKYQTLKWDFGDGNTLSGSTNPNHIYNLPGVYETILIASDAGTCSDTIKKSITITSLVTSTHGGLSLQEVAIYPVPVQQLLYFDIQTSFNTNADILISNMLGQIVYKQTNVSLKETNNILDLSILSSGLYYLSIQTPSQQFTTRFTKE